MEYKHNKGYKLPLTKQEIVTLYLSGQSCYTIAKTCNCSPTSIHYLLKQCNIICRTLSKAMTKYSHDTSFFDVIDTEEKAYFLGLLYADGNVSKKVISISLQEQDKHILDKFKECLKYTGPIISVTKKGNRKQQYKLTITSEPLVVSLSKWGMFPNKGFKLTFPQISPSLYNHFIRGYFDGDGCIYVNPKNYDYLFSIVATKEVLEPLQNILIKELGLNKTKLYNPPKVKGMNLFILTYQGRINVALIKDYLYTNATIYLQRKYEKFMVLSSQI